MRNVGLAAVAARPEVTSCHHILGVKDADNVIATQPEFLLLDLQNHILVVVSFFLVIAQQMKTSYAFQTLFVGLVDTLALLVEPFDACEIGQSHGGADLGHLGVGTKRYDLVVAGEPEVPQKPYPLSDTVVVGRYRPAFEGVKYLGGMEAKNLSMAETADHGFLVTAAEGVSRIEEQPEIIMSAYIS
jgi:hypothetical protein